MRRRPPLQSNNEPNSIPNVPSSHSSLAPRKHERRVGQRLKFILKCLSVMAVCALLSETARRHSEQNYNPYEKPRDVELWSGEKKTRPENNDAIKQKVDTVEIAIAYCHADLSWMAQGVLHQIPSTVANIKITVLSKCGHERDVPKFHRMDSRVAEADFNVVPLANVGGCDYAYAYYLNHYIGDNTKKRNVEESSVILFIKDTPRIRNKLHMTYHERYRSIRDMIQIAFYYGFSCGAKLNCDVSPFHDTATLYDFRKESYVRVSDVVEKGASRDNAIQPGFNTANYANLRDFHLRALNWTFPKEDGLTEGCYGGTFAVSASRIMELSHDPRVRRAMRMLEDHLQRNATTTIEEHFAERTWAGLFAYPLSLEHMHVVQGMGKTVIKDVGQLLGALRGDKYEMCSKFQLYKIYCRRRWCSLWSK
mmetsp:Transcript_5197/g.7917  ORF Transcript_5197/g.7917 Transcript_5197/m.7917 type:complete len:422 (-) Transcript_5197:156-1421(-)